MTAFFDALFSTSLFMSHGHCYLWNPALVRLHFLSDLSIGIAYVAISLTLVHLVYRARRDIPFHWIFLAFGLFIIACGGTHFMEVWTIWTPLYWLSGGVKAITALASVATAVVLPPLVPKTLGLIREAKLSNDRRLKLERANRELEDLYAQIKQLDELKTQFFANVSHELRTPVALILGPVEKLLESNDLPAQQRHQLQVVDRNARTLLKHINDLLDLSKLEAGKQKVNEQPMDLAKVLRLTAANFESFAEDRGITLVIETPEHLDVLADGEKLQRVLSNLLSNAFKYAPEGGRVRCRLSAAEQRVIATVEDNGPGVAPELRETIFERFQQGQHPSERLQGGMGLGLAIAKEFVELHDGTIEIGDAPGGGAIFKIEMPLKTADRESVSQNSSEGMPDPVSRALHELTPRKATGTPKPDGDAMASEFENSTPLVLVVEDNIEMNSLIAETLGSEYRTASAFNGSEAIQKAIQLRPDLIVCDVMMPETSGDQFVRQLRSRREFDRMPIVMLTAKADDRLRLELLENFAQDFATKPIQGRELRARVRNLINLQQSEAALLRSQQELRVLTSRLVSAQEEERARLARELHDGLNQRLAALAIYAGTLQDRVSEPPEVLRGQLSTLEERVIKISDEVRRLSHQLHPASLEYVGLAAALRTHCKEFTEESGIPIVVEVYSQPASLPREVSTCLFRIAQEGLRNVSKHSGARQVRLLLNSGPEEIKLSIVDNGVGFEVEDARMKGGLGLISMKERTLSLGGVLSVSSAQGEGTAVVVTIPLGPNAADNNPN